MWVMSPEEIWRPSIMSRVWVFFRADSARRVRWRETLDRFPFVVRHRPGKEMHVDGMTRHSTWPKDTGDSRR
jgi:hypothetical protein